MQFLLKGIVWKAFFVLLLLLTPITYGATVSTHSSLPKSEAPIIDRGTFTISQDFTPGSTEYWEQDGLKVSDERQIFRAVINYVDVLYPPRDFELRMGQGGQFYSIRTSIGELIARQHTDLGSWWNDQVVESVVGTTNIEERRSGNSNNGQLNKNSDMNQGGTYVRDGLKKSFYSPMLRFEKLNDQEIRSIIWTPISNLPSTYQSGVFYDQRTKNLGDGVIEVTQLITNAGPDALENRQLWPWAFFSGRLLDQFGYYSSAGDFVRVTGSWKEKANTFDTSQSNGSFQFISSAKNIGVSIITGGEKYDIGNGNLIWRKSDFRLGEQIRKRWPDDPEIILSNRRFLNIKKGETVFARYYIAIGTDNSMKRAINKYTRHADYGFVAYTESTSETEGLNYVCASGKLLTIDGCSKSKSLFALYDHPVTGSVPFLVLQNNNSKAYVFTPDPYAISRLSKDNPGRFYDGTTKYVSLLGWLVPQNKTTLAAENYINPEEIDNFDLGGFRGYVLRKTKEIDSRTNRAPVAENQSVTTAEDTAKTISLGATDADRDVLTYIYTQPAHGTVSGTGPNVTYTPAANYNGTDSFTFKANDGKVDSNVATVSLTVSASGNGGSGGGGSGGNGGSGGGGSGGGGSGGSTKSPINKPISEMTIAELQSEIARIKALIDQLLAAAGTETSTACYAWTRSLKLGDTGADVTALQIYLTGTGHFTYSGGATGYFGGITEAAVAKWEAAHGIITPVVGYWGPIDQAMYASLCAN